jgi:NAD+ synthase
MALPLYISIAQLNPTVGDLDGNLHHARKALEKCPAHTDLVIFPELFVCGYPPEDLVLKPSFLDAVEKAIEGFAKEITTTHILMPCPWRQDGKTYNAVHLIGDGKILHTRFKHHLPNYGVFDEVRVFSPGPLPDPIPFGAHHLGVMICEDAWFSNVAAHLKKKGADFLIVPNASPFEIGKHERRLEICRERITETGLPLIYLNQIGGQDELVFDGASFALNEDGECVMQMPDFSEDIVEMIWDKSPTGNWLCKTEELHHLREGPEQIYQALLLGLRDYVSKNGFSGVLLGMSGGIDSAISAALAVDALGPDSVHCVMMPSVYTSQDSINDAAECCAALGTTLDTISIQSPVKAFEDELAHHFTPQTPDITHQNIQSRSRGLILMALSNASGKMVLSTGNKSEMATGYATLYGDMCGGFNALKDVYKTDVYAISRWRNQHKPDHAFGPAGPVIPERILTKAPTAELKPGQTDQDSLPPYDVLDEILRGLIEGDLDIRGTATRGHDMEVVARVADMLDRAEYKRRQAAPGIKITTRAFGRERRYPITNLYKNSTR